MAASRETRAEYAEAVRALGEALHAPDRQALLAPEAVAGSDDGLDQHVDNYLAASQKFFDESKADDPTAAWKAIATDLASAQEASGRSAGQEQALLAPVDFYASYMAEVADSVDPSVGTAKLMVTTNVAADGSTDPLSRVNAATEKIAADGYGTVKSAAALGIVSISFADISLAADHLLGNVASAAIAAEIEKLGHFFHPIKLALTKFLSAALDKIKALFGDSAVSDIMTKVQKFLTGDGFLSNAFSDAAGVPNIESLAGQNIHDDDAGKKCADTIDGIASRNANVEVWLGRGVSFFGFTGVALVALVPWGPLIRDAIWAGLLMGAIFVTTDHLDSPGLDWFNVVRPGVRGVLEAGCS